MYAAARREGYNVLAMGKKTSVIIKQSSLVERPNAHVPPKWFRLGAIHKLRNALRGGGRGVALALRNVTEGGRGG